MKQNITINIIGFITMIAIMPICIGCDNSQGGADDGVAGTNTANVCYGAGAAVTNEAAFKRPLWKIDENNVILSGLQRFDPNELLKFIKITPKVASVSVRVRGEWEYEYDGRRLCDTVYYHTISADFAFDKKYTIEILKGAPFTDGKVLSEPLEYSFYRPDSKSRVSFASRGRYLPSCGEKAVRIETMNVTNLVCRVSKIPARNIIQILARELSQYVSQYVNYGYPIKINADTKATEQLSLESKAFRVPLRPDRNKKVFTNLPVRSNDSGVVSNGVYLVAVRGDFSMTNKVEDFQFDWGDNFRLVCVTDIGLSIRHDESGHLTIWAVSLTKGLPLADIDVSFYGINNMVMHSVKTDKDGIARLKVSMEKFPFAVVAENKRENDLSFLTFDKSVDHEKEGRRSEYIGADRCEAFVWTDRGIYRHDEKIMTHIIVRNGKGSAPKPFPVELTLTAPDGKLWSQTTVMPDEFGGAGYSQFSVPDFKMSGKWTLAAKIPGKDGAELGRRVVKIENFAPPQIRVKTEIKTNSTVRSAYFKVSAEHLFGGPAKGLKASALVFFNDVPFIHKDWASYKFGDKNRRIKNSFTRMPKQHLNNDGEVVFAHGVGIDEKPSEMVEMTVQGEVTEHGGRGVSSVKARKTFAFYPYLVGVKFPDKIEEGAECDIALVKPDGTLHEGGDAKLKVEFSRVHYAYGYKQRMDDEGDTYWTWCSDRIETPVELSDDLIAVGKDGKGKLKLVTAKATADDYLEDETGRFVLEIKDEKTGVSFCREYVCGEQNNDAFQVSMANPAKLEITCDKDSYEVGERPRLTVKSAYKGTALLSVYRDRFFSSRVVQITNLTSVVELEALTAECAPNVDVTIDLVQSAAENRPKNLACRSYGAKSIKVWRPNSRIDVELIEPSVEVLPKGGAKVRAKIYATGETSGGNATRAVVTVVDEAINMLTNERRPDPVGFFAKPCESRHALYDIYNMLLPVLGKTKRSGFKTGGDVATELMGRLSPQKNRRFKPLGMWTYDIPLENGAGDIEFTLPEFVGEVRITAVVYNGRATGSTSIQRKVAPKVVMQPDAPRFVALKDGFSATLTLSNRSGKEGVVNYCVTAADGLSVVGTNKFEGACKIADGNSCTFEIPILAGDTIGEGHINFTAKGLGEEHSQTINMPIRPATAWENTLRQLVLQPGETNVFSSEGIEMPNAMTRSFVVADKMFTSLAPAVRYLHEYPFGCLEQTTSKMFPLIYAGGILNKLVIKDDKQNQSVKDKVDAGISRILSMVRSNDFSMWPDVNYSPWNPLFSVRAAHFLVEADKCGYKVPVAQMNKVHGFLQAWSMSGNTNVSVYACNVLALAKIPDFARQLHWYDRRANLGDAEKFLLARAFLLTNDKPRAKDLIDGASIPDSLTGRAHALITLVDYDLNDKRTLEVADAILDEANNNHSRHWDTTEGNVHALMALAAYRHAVAKGAVSGAFDVAIVKDGKDEKLAGNKERTFVGGGTISVVNCGTNVAFVSVHQRSLPKFEAVNAMSNKIVITRSFRMNGSPVTLNELRRGDVVEVMLTLSSHAARLYNNLVIEELIPACFEIEDGANPSRSPVELHREVRDDRVVIFTHPFRLLDRGKTCSGDGEKHKEKTFSYTVRVVGKGRFSVPGSSVEEMYDPSVRAATKPSFITIGE